MGIMPFWLTVIMANSLSLLLYLTLYDLEHVSHVSAVT